MRITRGPHPDLTALGDVPYGSIVVFKAQSPVDTRADHPYLLLKPPATPMKQMNPRAQLADCETGKVVKIHYTSRVEILPNAELQL